MHDANGASEKLPKSFLQLYLIELFQLLQYFIEAVGYAESKRQALQRAAQVH